MNPIEEFNKEKKKNIEEIGNNPALKKQGLDFMLATSDLKYTYNFSWLGRPIIQYPQDMIALQEIIWEVKPDLIIETGIAHGGSLIFSASILTLLGQRGKVLGIDIDIREHNRKEIENHILSECITMIQGSSVEDETIKKVYDFSKNSKNILLILDSNHTHDHVLAELRAYAPLVHNNSYCIVMDTAIEDMPSDYDWSPRSWGKGNNPKTAVWEYLKENPDFEIDKSIENKLLISVAPDGFLKKVR